MYLEIIATYDIFSLYYHMSRQNDTNLINRDLFAPYVKILLNRGKKTDEILLLI